VEVPRSYGAKNLYKPAFEVKRRLKRQPEHQKDRAEKLQGRDLENNSQGGSRNVIEKARFTYIRISCKGYVDLH
jgi:hypothetical protein